MEHLSLLLLNATLPTWQVVLFNAVGVISIFLQFMIFQMKARKHIILFSIASNVGWFSYFALQGDFISGLANVTGLLSNVIFFFRGKYRWADSKLWLALFLAIAGGLAIITFRDWRDVFPMIACLTSTVAFFMIKEQRIRLISIVTYMFFMCNSISKLYIVALIADVTALLSAIISFIRYAKLNKKESLQAPVSDINSQE